MKFFCFILLFISFSFGFTPVWATPVTNLQLTYSDSTGTIHLEADHITDNLNKHYIRTVIITRNSKDKQYLYFNRQTRSDKFVTDLIYTVIPGDQIDVEIYCNQGGITKGALSIPVSQ